MSIFSAVRDVKHDTSPLYEVRHCLTCFQEDEKENLRTTLEEDLWEKRKGQVRTL